MKMPKNLIKDTQKLVRIKLFMDKLGIGKYLNSVGEIKEVRKVMFLGRNIS